jgi:hypothetical protein
MDSAVFDRWKSTGFTKFRRGAPLLILKEGYCCKCNRAGYSGFPIHWPISNDEFTANHMQEASDGLPILYGNVCGVCLTGSQP